MLTIENFPKINNSAIKNGWWISICRCHQDYYSFKLIQKDANNRVCDSFSVLLSRESIWMDEIKKNAYRFVVNKQKNGYGSNFRLHTGFGKYEKGIGWYNRP